MYKFGNIQYVSTINFWSLQCPGFLKYTNSFSSVKEKISFIKEFNSQLMARIEAQFSESKTKENVPRTVYYVECGEAA